MKINCERLNGAIFCTCLKTEMQTYKNRVTIPINSFNANAG